MSFFPQFLAYDTQMIMGGRDNEYSEEDYISAVTELYVDIVMIFIYLLQIIGGIDG